jgi:hypothetical protein
MQMFENSVAREWSCNTNTYLETACPGNGPVMQMLETAWPENGPVIPIFGNSVTREWNGNANILKQRP